MNTKTFYVAAALWSLLNLADYLTTSIVLQLGGAEANPLAVAVMNYGMTAFLVYKVLAIPVLSIGGFLLLRKVSPAKDAVAVMKVGTYAMTILCIWFIGIAINNTYCIVRLMQT
jgi:hypothetical protein